MSMLITLHQQMVSSLFALVPLRSSTLSYLKRGVGSRNQACSAVSNNTTASLLPDMARVDATGKNLSSIASISFGPAALLGGTAAVYYHAAFSPKLTSASLTITPLAAICMLLLALQYSIQPRITKRLVSPKVNKQSLALAEELAKGILAVAVYSTALNPTQRAAACSGWSISSSLLVAGLPAAMYAMQGVCNYYAYCNLDFLTFNGLSQTKTISAAICCFLILGKPQSTLQILALGMLCASALIFQGSWDLKGTLRRVFGKEKKDNKLERKVAIGLKTAFNTKENMQVSSNSFALGVVPCLAATFLSGLAGSLSQKGLQLTGGTGRNVYLYSMEVSFYSAFCLLLSMFFDRKRHRPMEVTRGRPFDYWTPATLVPILIKATGGLLTALVHKHAGTVVKGFSLVLGLVLTGAIQSILDGQPMNFDQILGTLLVIISSWLHLTNPSL